MFLRGEEMTKFVEIMDRLQIQPAGIDLTVREIERIVEPGEIDFTNKMRRIPKGEKIEFEEKVELEPGAYRIRYRELVEVPRDCIGILLPRSSLLRMGATIFGALWDPGYRGRGQGLMLVFNPYGIILHRNARVAQLTFIKGKLTEGYKGTYQNEQ